MFFSGKRWCVKSAVPSSLMATSRGQPSFRSSSFRGEGYWVFYN